jgi:hypothetical protein
VEYSGPGQRGEESAGARGAPRAVHEPRDDYFPAALTASRAFMMRLSETG